MTNYIETIRRDLAAEVLARCPGWDIAETPSLLDSYALLVLAVGEAVTSELVHDAWSIWSNTISPEHRYLIPFALLPTEVQQRDEVGRDAIATVAARRTGWRPVITHGAHPTDPALLWGRVAVDLPYLERTPAFRFVEHVTIPLTEVFPQPHGQVTLTWWAERGPLAIRWDGGEAEPAAGARWAPGRPVPDGTTAIALWASTERTA